VFYCGDVRVRQIDSSVSGVERSQLGARGIVTEYQATCVTDRQREREADRRKDRQEAHEWACRLGYLSFFS
jgi:hypothetical protein